MPEPGRLLESLPTGVDPGTMLAKTTAPHTAPDTPGGAGASRDAGHLVTFERTGPRDRDSGSRPTRTEIHITFIIFKSRFLFL